MYQFTSCWVNVGLRNATSISVRTKVALSKAPSLSTHSEVLVRAKRVSKRVSTQYTAYSNSRLTMAATRMMLSMVAFVMLYFLAIGRWPLFPW